MVSQEHFLGMIDTINNAIIKNFGWAASILALFSAADLGAQALAFAKDFVTFVTAGLPIVLMLFWKGRGY